MKKEEYNTKYNSCDFEINNDNNKINYNIYFFYNLSMYDFIHKTHRVVNEKNTITVF